MRRRTISAGVVLLLAAVFGGGACGAPGTSAGPESSATGQSAENLTTGVVAVADDAAAAPAPSAAPSTSAPLASDASAASDAGTSSGPDCSPFVQSTVTCGALTGIVGQTSCSVCFDSLDALIGVPNPALGAWALGWCAACLFTTGLCVKDLSGLLSCLGSPYDQYDVCVDLPDQYPGFDYKWYCGNDPKIGGSNQAAVECQGGRTVQSLICPPGTLCSETPTPRYLAQGKNITCYPTDPCAGTQYDRKYCGVSTEFGFNAWNTSDPSKVYTCHNHQTYGLQICQYGCGVVDSPSQDDFCTPTPTGPCVGVSGSRDFCGQDMRFGFAGGTTDTLYECVNGQTFATQPCTYGCTEASAQSANDTCFTPPPDPCWIVTEDGYYCGQSTELLFMGGKTDYLYHCVNRATSGSPTYCGYGCQVNPPHVPDACNPPPNSNPCANVPSWGNGAYCGLSTQAGFAGGKSNVVYDCENGRTVGQTICSGDCVVAPPGVADYCQTSLGSCNGGLVCGRLCCPANNYCGQKGNCCDGITCSFGCGC